MASFNSSLPTGSATLGVRRLTDCLSARNVRHYVGNNLVAFDRARNGGKQI
jgi:hypothetical protein